MAKSDGNPLADVSGSLPPRDSAPGPADAASAPATSVAEAQAAPDVMNAADLTRRIFRDMPRLEVAGMERVIGAVTAELSLEHMGVPIEMALRQLKVAGVPQSLIRAGISAMNSASDKEALEAADSFNEKAGPGREVDSVTLDPAQSESGEKAEQAVYRKMAVELKARVAPLRSAIFEVKDSGGIVGWVRTGLRKLDEATLTKSDSSPAAELPGWKTPPKLDENNPQVKSLLDQLELIESTYALVQDAAKTLTQLHNLNFKFTPDHVKGVLDACDALADEQIVQSTTIDGVADADAAAFVAKAQMIAFVRATAEKAADYLNSGKK